MNIIRIFLNKTDYLKKLLTFEIVSIMLYISVMR